jgi:HEAT repeat protein
VKTLSGVLTRDKDRIVRGMAAISLGRVGGEAAATALRHAQAENEASMRAYVALALGLVARNSKDDAIAKSLIRDLTASPQSDVAGALCIAVGLTGHADAVPVLRGIVKDAKDPDVRGHAAVALGLVHDTNEGSAAVRSLLDLQVPHVQSEGAIGLGLMASRESVTALGDTLEHGTVPGTQAAAALALGRIGGADAAHRLTAVLSDPSRPLIVRRMAINGLGIALDREGGRPTSMVGASLDWCALTMSVVDVVSIQ